MGDGIRCLEKNYFTRSAVYDDGTIAIIEKYFIALLMNPFRERFSVADDRHLEHCRIFPLSQAMNIVKRPQDFL
jgi:hypothetical protein